MRVRARAKVSIRVRVRVRARVRARVRVRVSARVSVRVMARVLKMYCLIAVVQLDVKFAHLGLDKVVIYDGPDEDDTLALTVVCPEP